MQFPNHTYCQRALWGLLLPLVYLLGFGSTQAQAPAIFHDVSKGLSQNTVTSIAQDEQGFLWVGTRYGLNKYDGNSYQHFFHDSKDSNSLTVNTIEKLISGKNGILWIGTENGGLNKMHIPSGKITSFTIDNSTIKSNYIRTFYLDEQGLLYIAGDNTGLDIFDTKTETFLRAEQHPLIKSMEGEDISAIHGNTTGVFVIGTIQRGVFYYNAITNRLDHHPEVAAQVNAVADAGISDFVIGTNQGIYLGEVIQNSLTIRKPNYPTINQSVILSLETEGDGTIWVGTENDGLGKIDPDRKLQTYSANVDQDGINGNSIWSIFQDHSGRIWMGYYLKGISKIDALEEKFRKISVVDVGSQKVSLNLVNAFASPNDSVVWIGLEEVGLIEWNRKTNAFQSIDAFWEQGSDRVVTALMYAKGNLWIGTWNEGLIKYNVENRSFQKFSRAAGNLIGDKILRIFKDKTERIWVSVQDEGLQLFDQELGFQQAYTKGTGPNQIANVRIRFLTEDCDGNILLGSERGGLVKLYLEGTNIVRQESLISEKDEINDDISTNCLLVDSECNLWIGTEGLGLFLLKYDQPQPIQFTMEQGLPSNRICALEQDKKGDIWGSLNDGLFSFDAKENTFYHYSIEDGLVSNEFEVGASYKLRDGTIFFGATSGINYFVPIEIPFNDTPPEPYITHIYISNQEFATKQGLLKPAHYNGQQITTRFKENDISFGFTGLNLTQGKLNKFQHKLEGFDEDWSPISNKRIAEYANIPYGKYTFVLRAANNDGVWSSVHPQVFLHVKTPWYSTYLAWAIYILVAGTIIFVIQKSIINQINLRNELAMEHIEVSKLKELDKLKSKFFANISHEFLTPLTLILTPLKGIQSRGNNQISDQTVETIINNANRLQKFIKQILALAKLETGNVKLRIDEHDLSPWLKTITNNFRSIASDKSMTFRVEIPDRKVLAFYDEDRLEQVLVNLLSNAFKYTDNQGLVNLKLREEKDQISISIEDTGQGIPKEDVENIFNRFYRQKNENIISGTGIGLSITKQIIIQHDATIAVNSTPGKGSTFTVVLKKGKDHFVDNPTVEFVYNEPSTSEFKPMLPANLPFQKMDQTPGQAPMVLIVEDNPEIRALLSEHLSRTYEVYLAEDGIQGIQMAKKLLPDLIITDLMMPGKNGYELCQAIKQDQLTSHIFIIMLTVKSSEESVKKGLQKGADYYLTKPFNLELLELNVQNILRYRQNMAKSLMNEDTEQATIETQTAEELQISEIDLAFLKKLNDTIEKNLANSDFSVVDLTQELQFSKSQLYRKLKAMVGMSANTYIRTKRLQRALELLKTDQYTVAEVTYKVGFNDLQYFRSCFKNQYGVNPSEYLSRPSSEP